MYKCSRCNTSTRPYQSRLLKVTRRTLQDPVTGMQRSDISKEEPVCPSCAVELGIMTSQEIHPPRAEFASSLPNPTN